jgi:drug/metabolite transporter (DMT)-like permease
LASMLVVFVGLTSAITFGGADFLGGLASKKMPAITVTAIATLTGFVLLLIAVPFIGGDWSPRTIVLGMITGVSGAIAISLLYACLAIGPMSILSPLTAVVSAVVPVSVGLARGERLQPIGYLALGVALVAIVLVGFVPEKGAVRPALRGILMAVGSGTAIGIFLIVMDLTPNNSGLVPLVLNRGVESILMLGLVAILALRTRKDAATLSVPKPRRSLADVLRGPVRIAIACGVVDVIANAGLLAALHIGELSIVSVLTALYPIGTIILAAIVLKERVAPVQYVGLALAIGASAMLAIA